MVSVNPAPRLEVDGGVDATNAARLVAAGAGLSWWRGESSISGAGHAAARTRDLRAAAARPGEA